MPELETIEGHVETRDPETEVLLKKHTKGGDRIYHEIPEGYEQGDNPPCGAHTRNGHGYDYEVVSLKAAIRKWAEPCGHAECAEIRNGGVAEEEYKREDVLYELYWTQKLTLGQIASKFDVDDKTISRWMRRNSIPRTKGGYRDVYDEEPPTKRYRDISDDELETIETHFEHGLLYQSSRANKVHLPNDDAQPMCRHQNGKWISPAELGEVEAEDLCKQCVERWRI